MAAEDQVCDRLVAGLRGRKLKDRLQLTHNLTLTEAHEIARQHKQIKPQIKEQNNKASNEADQASR